MTTIKPKTKETTMYQLLKTTAIAVMLMASWYFILLVFWSFDAEAQANGLNAGGVLVPPPSGNVIINQPNLNPYANYWNNLYPELNGYGYGYGYGARGYSVITKEVSGTSSTDAFFYGRNASRTNTTIQTVVPNTGYGYPQIPIWLLLQP